MKLNFLKKSKHCVLSIGLILIIIYLCVINTSFLDNTILLEKIFPVFFYNLYLNTGEESIIIPELNNYSYSEILEKNILNAYELNSLHEAGITIENDSKTLTFSGEAEDTFFPGATRQFINLTDGWYYITTENGCVSAYIEGFKGDDHTLITWIKDCSFFYADSSLYDTYRYTFYIREGSKYDSEIVRPVISKITNNSDDKNQMKIYVRNIDKTTWNRLSKKERKLFDRSIVNLYSDYDWVSVRFEDMTGIQYFNGEYTEGPIDYCGRVIE